MSNFEWFLLIVVVIVVPLIVAVAVTLWTIDQANKRKRANRADPQVGVKRKAALTPEEVEARKAERRRREEEAARAEDAVVSPAAEAGPPAAGDAVGADSVSRETRGLTSDASNR